MKKIITYVKFSLDKHTRNGPGGATMSCFEKEEHDVHGHDVHISKGRCRGYVDGLADVTGSHPGDGAGTVHTCTPNDLCPCQGGKRARI